MMRTSLRTTITAAVLAVAVSATTATAVTTMQQPAAPVNAHHMGALSGDDLIFSGCVIRFDHPDGKTPRLHPNEAHSCVGVESVAFEQNMLRINQTVQGAQCHPVVTAWVQTDETVGGMRGIMAGVRGGTGHTFVRMWDTRLDRRLYLEGSDRARIWGPGSNIWVGWIHRVVPGCAS